MANPWRETAEYALGERVVSKVLEPKRAALVGLRADQLYPPFWAFERDGVFAGEAGLPRG